MKILYILILLLVNLFSLGCAGFNTWVLLPGRNYVDDKNYVLNFNQCAEKANSYLKSNEKFPDHKIQSLIGDKNLDRISPLYPNASNKFNQLYAICMLDRGFEFAEVPVNTTGSETLCDTYHRYKRGKVNMDTLNNWCQIRLGVDECTKCIARKQ